jgi:DNA polymerase III epsilon subunit-like protein
MEPGECAAPGRLPEKEVVIALIERLTPRDNSVVVLIGYNVATDISKYQAAAKRHGLAFPAVYYWDAYHKGVRMCGRFHALKDKSQQGIAEFLDIEVINAHDSFDDTQTLACIIQAAVPIPPLDSDRWQLTAAKGR